MDRGRLFVLLALFFVVFELCAGLLQVRSGLPPEKSGAIDQFNAALLWASSILGLLIAERSAPAWRVVFWLCVSAGFGALAIDEVYEFHEGTKISHGDDDYIKVLAWGCAVVGVWLIRLISRPVAAMSGSLAAALVCTTLWLLADMGDGDFFTAPIPLSNLLWLEEYFELFASMAYLTAFVVHYRESLPPARQARMA